MAMCRASGSRLRPWSDGQLCLVVAAVAIVLCRSRPGTEPGKTLVQLGGEVEGGEADDAGADQRGPVEPVVGEQQQLQQVVQHHLGRLHRREVRRFGPLQRQTLQWRDEGARHAARRQHHCKHAQLTSQPAPMPSTLPSDENQITNRTEIQRTIRISPGFEIPAPHQGGSSIFSRGESFVEPNICIYFGHMRDVSKDRSEVLKIQKKPQFLACVRKIR